VRGFCFDFSHRLLTTSCASYLPSDFERPARFTRFLSLSLANRNIRMWRRVKFVSIVVFAVSSALAHAQGTVVFSNRHGVGSSFEPVDAPVFYGTSGHGPGPDFTAQLNLIEPSGVLRPLLPLTTFRPAGEGPAAIADRYWMTESLDVPGVGAGQPATFIVRVWRTSLGSFENAREATGEVGESLPVTIRLGSGGGVPPAPLFGLQSFTVIPEPLASLVLALGLMLFACNRPMNGGRSLRTTHAPG
jgi:hypothetical protein